MRKFLQNYYFSLNYANYFTPPIFLDFAISTCQNEDICVVAVVWFL